MSIKPIVETKADFESFFISGSIKKFEVNQNEQKVFKNQLSTSYRDIRKMKDLFLKGPCRESQVLTLDKDWNIGNGLSLNTVRDKIKEKGLFCFLSYMRGEGGSVWVLTPDEKWASESGVSTLGGIINKDLSSKSWSSAFNNASKEADKDGPFAISYVGSVTCQTMPWFGRSVYGTSLANDVISIVQIPLMGGSTEHYFSWLFVPKIKWTPSDWENIAGKGGRDYNRFKQIRKRLEQDCEPLKVNGSYSFDPKNRPDTKQGSGSNTPDSGTPDSGTPPQGGNPLTDQAGGGNNPPQGGNESIIRKGSYAIHEALHNARSIISEVYIREAARWGSSEGEWYKGNPFENKLEMENGIPKYGPLY